MKCQHIKVWRGLYCHHGLRFGDMVIHFTGTPFRKGLVESTGVETFAEKGRIITVSEIDDDGTVLKRAVTRLGETAYDLLFNNCEHFVNWCLTGKSKSNQVRLGTAGVAALIFAGGFLLNRKKKNDKGKRKV